MNAGLLAAILGQGGAGGYDAAAQDWFDRIVAAGSTINNDNKAAASALFATLRSNGYLAGPLVEMGLFAGPDSEAGALVKAWDGASTGAVTKVGTAFTFDRVSGVKATAAATYLQSATNLNYAGFGDSDFSMGFYTPESLISSNVRYLSIGGNNQTDIVGGSSILGRMRSGSVTTGPADTASGFYGWRRTSSAGGNVVTPGNAGTFSTSVTVINPGTVKIFAQFDGTSNLVNKFVSVYFLGNASIDLTIMRTALNTYIAALT